MDFPTTNRAYAVIEKWATTLTQYISAVGIVLVIYDYLLTIRNEVCLIHRHLGLRAVSV
jgi:hypothetical protein